MSLPEMLGGAAECGPVNPLQQLGKRFGQDRGTQLDAHRGPAPGADTHAFRSRGAQAQDPAFFAREASTPLAPFQVDQMRSALPSIEKSPWHEMEASFAHAQPRAGPSQAATPGWARDFLRHGGAPTHAATAPAPYAPAHAAGPAHPPAAMAPGTFAPRPAMQPQLFRPHWQGMHRAPMLPAPQEAQQAPAMHAIDASSWDSAFTAVDAQNRATHVEAPAEALPTEAEVGQMDADALAETAAKLLANVDQESDKFQQSEFLALMRRLRDRQAEVQGATIVDKGKGRAADVPTKHDLERLQAEGMARLRERVVPNAASMQHQQPHLEGNWDLQEFWAQEDAAREVRERAEQVRRQGFVGDGGDVQARMREDDAALDALHQNAARARETGTASPAAAQDPDAIHAEFQKWQDIGAQVPGARSGWEEDVMTEQPQHTDDNDFVGRAWTGTQGRGRIGAQEAEWAKLQSDWDEFDAHASGVARDAAQEPFPFTAPTYRFHEANPYLASTRQHARHAPTAEDGVLEHEAAVQDDPTRPDAWYGLGLRQQENEREKQAIAALRKALELDPRMREAWLALAVSYTNENDRDAALEAIERWIHTNDVYADVVRGHSSRSTDRHRRLASVLMAMARAGRSGESIDAEVQVALGVLFNSCSEFDKAVDCFSAALSARPDDWLLYNRIGATLSNSGRARESLAYYHQAISLRPGFARCHFNMSISCLNLKMYQDAAEHAYTALALQHASDEDQVPKELRGAQNNSLWEILRVSLELMHRSDLARKVETRDINALQLEEILGM